MCRSCSPKATALEHARDILQYAKDSNMATSRPRMKAITRIVHSPKLFAYDKWVHQSFNIVISKEMPICWNTINHLLQACTNKNVEIIRHVYQVFIINGVASVSCICDHVIRLFTSCDSMIDAQRVFNQTANPTVYTWHAIISAHTKLGDSNHALELYMKMQEEGIKPNKFVLLCVLKACSTARCAREGRNVHDDIIRMQIDSDQVLRNTLVDMYSKCGSLEEACHIFHKLDERDIVSWGSMIAGHAAYGQGHQAFQLFVKMQQEGIEPNSVIFLCILRACSSIEALEEGMILHDQIICSELHSDDTVGSALIDMYSKCGDFANAKITFDRLPNKDVVSWSAMIAAYAEQGQGELALAIYKEMLTEAVKPSKVTFVSLLKACGATKELGCGRLIHKEIVVNNYGLDLVVGNALIDMYSKFGSVQEAHKVFNFMPTQDGISWNSVIQGYVQQEFGVSALNLFSDMHQKGCKPNKVTYPIALRACSIARAVVDGRKIHEEIIRRSFESEMIIQSAVVDMYAKCGCMKEAQKVFDAMKEKDIVLWGTVLAGYAQSGDWGSARIFFQDMKMQCFKPDSWVFSSILSACSHSGKVEEGVWYFKSMILDYGIKPTTDHFNCIVDLLGRTGCLKEARDIVQCAPGQLDENGWTSLLNSCRMYGNKELGSKCFSEATPPDLESAAGCVLISKIYSESKNHTKFMESGWKEHDISHKGKLC